MMELFDAFILFFTDREPLRVILDIGDILLVAYVFYRVLLLVRGTRAMQMGIGLVLVFLLYHLARRVGLTTLFSILDGLLTYIVLIIVVVFQNDIRRALMRVGSRPFLRGARSVRETQVIDEVVKAVASLTQKRIGGLIVFERDAALDEFIEPGTKLDAEVSEELLYSIFVPSYENPMHDGAVIIREGRVWQAGAFLPLTDSKKVDRTFGTRHRAAIGISEETDAIVVVVSEERGQASVCFAGNIVRDIEPTMLRETLKALFDKKGQRKRSDQTGKRLSDAGEPPREDADAEAPEVSDEPDSEASEELPDHRVPLEEPSS